MGYVRGFIHGTITGTVIGLCVAPQPGKKTREQLNGLAAAARDGYDIAQKTVRRVAPYAATAATAAREKVRKHDEDEVVSVERTVRVRSEDGHSA